MVFEGLAYVCHGRYRACLGANLMLCDGKMRADGMERMMPVSCMSDIRMVPLVVWGVSAVGQIAISTGYFYLRYMSW